MKELISILSNRKYEFVKKGLRSTFAFGTDVGAVGKNIRKAGDELKRYESD